MESTYNSLLLEVKEKLKKTAFYTVNEGLISYPASSDTYLQTHRTLQKCVFELWLMYHYPMSYPKYETVGQNSWDDEIKREGSKVDYRIGESIFIEMKTKLGSYNPTKFRNSTRGGKTKTLIPRGNLSDEMRKVADIQYGKGNQDLKFIYFELNKNVFRSSVEFVQHSELLELMLLLMESVKSISPPQKEKRNFKMKLDDAGEEPLSDITSRWEKERINTDFQTIPEMVNDIINPANMKLIEEWGETKYLRTKDVPFEIIDDPSKINVNLKNIYSKEGSFKLTKDGIGRKSPFLSLGPLEFQPLPFIGDEVIEDEYFNIYKEVLSLNNRNEGKLKEFKSILKDLSFLKSTKTSKDTHREIMEKWRGNPLYKLVKKAESLEKKELRDMLEIGEISEKAFAEEMKKYSDDAILQKVISVSRDLLSKTMKKDNPSDDIDITKQGNIGLRRDNELTKKGMVGSKTKTNNKDWVRTQCELGVKDHFEEVEKYYNKIETMGFYDQVKYENFSTEGAYKFNSSFEKVNNLLDAHSIISFEEITKGPLASKAWRQSHLINTIKSSIPLVKTKRMFPNTILYGECPHTNAIWLSTPAVSQKTGGASIIFYKFRKGTPINKWENVIVMKEDDEFIYCRTKPFRLNWEYTNAVMGMLGGLLGLMTYSNSLGNDLHKSVLVWHLILNYSRQNKKMLDIVYMMDHNIYYNGTYGKDKAKEKINPEHISHPIMSTMLFRYKRSYTAWATAIDGSLQEKKPDFGDLRHPVFGFLTRNIKEVMISTYLKQLLPSDDGGNSNDKLYRYMMKELKLEGVVYNNPFFRDKFPMDSKMTMHQYINTLFKRDENGKLDWLPYSYLPGMCYRMWEKTCKETILFRERKKKKGPIQFAPDTSLETEAPTSTLTTWDLKGYYGISEKTGFAPFHLWLKTKEKLEKYHGDWPDEFKKEWKKLSKDIIDLQNIGIMTMTTAEALSLIEAKYSESLTKMRVVEVLKKLQRDNPTNGVVTMREKVQKDFDGRAFFIQRIDMRCVNKAWDELMKDLLDASESDILNKPGLHKNIKIQEQVDFVSNQVAAKYYLPCSTTEDQTRYGDTYSVESMILALHAMRNTGLITNETFCILRQSAEQVRNRILIIPPQLRKQLNSNPDPESVLGKKMQELRTAIKINQQMSIVDTKEMREMEHMRDVMEDTFLTYRIYGGVLGVFNRMWSVFSGQIKELIKQCMETVTASAETFKSVTHSDDSSNYSVFPCITQNLFKKGDFSVTKLLIRKQNLENSFQQKIRCIESIGKDYKDYVIKFQGDLNYQEVTNVSSQVLTKMFLLLSVFCPRPLSQVPSEFKCSFGPASEVLQQVTYLGEIFIPVIRLLTQIVGDNPAESFSKDIYQLMGRVYDLLTHKLDDATLHSIMKIINIFVWKRYGIPKERWSLNIPTELGGGFFAIPTLILQTGMRANRARLLALSEIEPELERLLQLMTNSSEVWIIRENKELADMGFTINEEGSGAPEVWKDLMLSWASDVSAANGLNRIVQSKKIIEKKVLSKREFEILYKLYTKEGPESQLLKIVGDSKSPNILQHLNTLLSRYVRPGFITQYKKIARDSVIASRFGWGKRAMNNPFSQNFRDTLGIDDKVVTIYQVIDLLKKAAEGTFTPPDICVKALSAMKTSYAEEMSYIRETSVQFELTEDKINRFASLPSKYLEFIEGYNPPLSMKSSIETAYQSLIMDELPTSLSKELETFLASPLPKDETWKGYKVSLKTMTESIGIKGIISLSQHKMLLIALIMDNYREPVAKLYDKFPMNRLENSLIEGKSFTKTSKRSPIQIPLERIGFDYKLQNWNKYSNIVNASLNVSELLRDPLFPDMINIQIYEAGKQIEINSYETTKQLFLAGSMKGKEKEWSSDVLTAIMYSQVIEKKIFKTSLIKKKNMTEVSCQIWNWVPVMIEREKDTFLMAVGGAGEVPFGLMVSDYLSRMSCFMTCCFFNKGIRSRLMEYRTTKKLVDPRIRNFGVLWEDGQIERTDNDDEKTTLMYPKVGAPLNVSFNTWIEFPNVGVLHPSHILFNVGSPRNPRYYRVAPWKNANETHIYEAIVTNNENGFRLKSDLLGGKLSISKWYFTNYETGEVDWVPTQALRAFKNWLETKSTLCIYADNISFYLSILKAEYNRNLNIENSKFTISCLLCINKFKTYQNQVLRNQTLEHYISLVTEKASVIELKIYKNIPEVRNVFLDDIIWETENELAINNLTATGFARAAQHRLNLIPGMNLLKNPEEPDYFLPKNSILQIITYMEGGKRVQMIIQQCGLETNNKDLSYKIANSIPSGLVETLVESGINASVIGFIRRIPKI
jgi:hypothetical protein